MIELFGGPDRDRTDDLFHAMEARSQLRHRPTCCRDATLLLSLLGVDSSNNLAPSFDTAVPTGDGILRGLDRPCSGSIQMPAMHGTVIGRSHGSSSQCETCPPKSHSVVAGNTLVGIRC